MKSTKGKHTQDNLLHPAITTSSMPRGYYGGRRAILARVRQSVSLPNPAPGVSYYVDTRYLKIVKYKGRTMSYCLIGLLLLMIGVVLLAIITYKLW